MSIFLNDIVLHFPQLGLMNEVALIIYFFTIYSLMGWLLENCYNLIINRKFFKPNFFFGPFKPMYGFAPLLLVYLVTPETNWMIVILLCFLIPTFVEYVSGVLLQKFFNRQWWDYSSLPLQLHGHICLPFSICWVALSFVCLKFIHPEIAGFYERIEPVWNLIWPIAVLYFIAELIIAFRRHTALTHSISNHIQ
ncbi:putative ABC transporter permease [Cytobacillus praedii]|uniref:putative ABC transporter permease n=1 Tax=Cytobacillus praedii TaxID=1742358 RepID=UPI002E245693|nr:putative ABC transporter permease [Cytobacillus praedii]